MEGSTAFISNPLQCLTTLTVKSFSLSSIGIPFLATCAFCHFHPVFPSTSQTSGHIFSISLLQAVENSSKDHSLLVVSKERSCAPPSSNATGCSPLITSARLSPVCDHPSCSRGPRTGDGVLDAASEVPTGGEQSLLSQAGCRKRRPSAQLAFTHTGRRADWHATSRTPKKLLPSGALRAALSRQPWPRGAWGYSSPAGRFGIHF